jgi:EAL domain-containing protein (putative c-di-GMP-specific phosphodiesterase class I)
MRFARLAHFISRHRLALRDLTVIAMVARLVSALVGLGQGLGLTIAADGIMTAGQSALLAVSGCQEGQGEWISAPVSAAETTLLFQNRLPHAPQSSTRPQLLGAAEESVGWADGSSL